MSALRVVRVRHSLSPRETEMKKTLAIAGLAAVVMVSAAAPAGAQMSGLKSLDNATTGLIHKTGKRSRRNGRIAAGVALGILGAAAAASSAHAYDEEYYRESRHERRCRRWRRWCHDGEHRACWKYDNRC
jgi:hypothetical protein